MISPGPPKEPLRSNQGTTYELKRIRELKNSIRSQKVKISPPLSRTFQSLEVPTLFGNLKSRLQVVTIWIFPFVGKICCACQKKIYLKLVKTFTLMKFTYRI